MRFVPRHELVADRARSCRTRPVRRRRRSNGPPRAPRSIGAPSLTVSSALVWLDDVVKRQKKLGAAGALRARSRRPHREPAKLRRRCRAPRALRAAAWSRDGVVATPALSRPNPGRPRDIDRSRVGRRAAVEGSRTGASGGARDARCAPGLVAAAGGREEPGGSAARCDGPKSTAVLSRTSSSVVLCGRSKPGSGSPNLLARRANPRGLRESRR